MTYTKSERDYYNQYRQSVCDKLGLTKNQYNYVRRQGEAYRLVGEDNCNGLLKDDEYITRSEAIERKLENYLSGLGLRLHVYYQTDPRGATVYLQDKPISRDRYTDALCVY